jgi:ABC-type cobalamin/Fe3+-siderophores transport system ATPase subunit
MFSEFIASLEPLRRRTARFRRVALHLHSIDSHDWPREASDKAVNQRSRFGGEAGLDVFLGELRKSYDCVGVTDHMKCTFGTQLSSRTVGGHDFVVLPGMEVNFRLEPPLTFARIHLLALLREGSTTHDFACFFTGIGVPAADDQRGGQEEVADISLKNWVERVHGEGGICIAAHVENQQGLRYRFRHAARETLQVICDKDLDDAEKASEVPENFKRFLLDSGLDAIEIHRTKDASHYRWVSEADGLAHSVATILTCDAHCIEEFQRADRTTHIKMTRMGLKGLKEALRFPDTRIRFPDNLPSPPSPRILGIQIVGGASSFFDNVTIALAENLNCLIGVRGSGKSTVVEALRYLFGYNRTLEELGNLEETVRDLQKANLIDSIIRVAYRTRSSDDRVLVATFDPKADYGTKVFSASGDPVEVADVEACGDYPLRLFGWSEIETLGRDPAKQRDLLDRLILELAVTVRRRESVRQRLKVSHAKIGQCVEEVKAAFAQNGRLIERYREYRTDFEKLNTPEVQGLFSALDFAQDKRRVLVRLRSNADRLIASLAGDTPVTLRAELEALLANGSDEMRKWWHEEEIGCLGVVAAESEIRGLLQRISERTTAFGDLVDEHVRQIDTHIGALQKDLQTRLAADDTIQKLADLRANAESRLRQASALRENYLKKWEALNKAFKERQAIADELVHVQDEIAGIRARHNSTVENTLNHFLPDTMRVSIDFRPGRDTEDFGKKLQSLFGARGNQAKRIRRLVEMFSTPVLFGQMLLDGNADGLIGKSDLVDASSAVFASEDAVACVEKTKPFERNEHADVDVLAAEGSRLETILELQETEWDDYEAILLNGAPVNEKSPGQRSSAMLPLIALTDTTPLVIDQPEDNLDKRLIGSVLMNVLAELKEKRQIIVCTHDPNILVGGDAEQVVVMEAESDRRGKVAQHGSIDNEDIVECVVNLLEGGAEAFEARRKRYRGHAGISS